jgi:hypothetical protein
MVDVCFCPASSTLRARLYALAVLTGTTTNGTAPMRRPQQCLLKLVWRGYPCYGATPRLV